jgi:flagellar biosynthetic protein FliR
MELAVSMGWLESVALAGVRMTAFVFIAPPFSYNAFPARIKAMLAAGLALAVAPRVSPGYVQHDFGGFLLALILEVAVGAALGFLVYLVFAAVQSAGGLIDMFGGFQMAQGFDPQSMINGAQFARLFHITAIALLFASGGYQLIIGGLARSFEALPVGAGIDLTIPAEMMVNGVTQMFLAAVQIAGPLLVVLFLADAGLGLLTRVAPALNAFALGFPLKILLTVTLSAVVFVVMPTVVSSLTGEAVGLLTGVR